MEEIFTQLGLDATEAKVYNALLELGPSTVTEITKKARITRTLGYHVLEKLEWYGIVGRAGGEGKKMKYAITHPQSLLQFVRNKKESWEARERQAEHVLPQLVSLFHDAEKPIINYQHGVEGVMSAHEDLFEAKTEVLTISDVSVWRDSEFWDWAKDMQRKRQRRKVKERMLFLDSPPDREFIRQYMEHMPETQCRLIKPEKLKGLADLGGEIHVYDKKVLLAVVKKPNRMGMVIESSVFANIIRALFDLAWESAEPMV